MKQFLPIFTFAALLAACAPAQVNIPLTGGGSESTPKRVKPTSKTLTGTVTDKNDQPIVGAVVYLKNSKTLAVKSFFTEQNGAYRFPSVAVNTDYEVWAEKDGKKSATKGVSQFDDRFTPTVNLRIDLSK